MDQELDEDDEFVVDSQDQDVLEDGEDGEDVGVGKEGFKDHGAGAAIQNCGCA